VSVFSESYDESYAVFKRYQMTVHNDSAFDCAESDFNNFLIESPLCADAAVCFVCSLAVVVFVVVVWN